MTRRAARGLLERLIPVILRGSPNEANAERSAMLRVASVLRYFGEDIFRRTKRDRRRPSGLKKIVDLLDRLVRYLFRRFGERKPTTSEIRLVKNVVLVAVALSGPSQEILEDLKKRIASIDTPKTHHTMRATCLRQFSELEITDGYDWSKNQRQTTCKRCGRRQRIYCGLCVENLAIGGDEDDPRPNILTKIEAALPEHFTLHTIIDNRSIDRSGTNATSLHAALLMKRSRVFVHRLDDSRGVRFDFAPGTAALLFPSKDATPIEDMNFDKASKLRHLVVIEATWGTSANDVASIPGLDLLPRVKIKAEPTTRPPRRLYWKEPPQDDIEKTGIPLLSTIEAIRIALRSLSKTFPKERRDHRSNLDELLFLLRIEALRRADALDSRGV